MKNIRYTDDAGSPYPYSFPDPLGFPSDTASVSPYHPAWQGVSPVEEFAALPEGLAMAFAQNTDALRRFTALSIPQQDDMIRRARSVSTRDEMQRLIGEILS